MTSDTGSGKTTQIPQFVLYDDLPHLITPTRGIAVVEPRIVACIESARRVAAEMDVELGKEVGYRVGGTKMTSSETIIEFMTDGYLAMEAYLGGDRNILAKRYSTIIIDEAHERSLDTDVLLAILRQLVDDPNNDLKLIIMSATINAASFLNHFPGSTAVHIAGGTPHFIHQKYLEKAASNLPAAIVDTVEHIIACRFSGDILVFLAGEEEISMLTRSLRPLADQLRLVVHQLYGAMTQEAKEAVLTSHTRTPPTHTRVILATNIAETSLTVENVVHVIDSGLERVDIYDPITKCEELRLTAVSKGSADQRKGRVGRTQAGMCWRMYTELSYERMPDHHPVPITRNRLTRVLLGLGNARPDQSIVDIPFLDAPHFDFIRDGYQELWIMGMVDVELRVTPFGEEALKLPCDLELAGMLLEGDRVGVAEEMLCLASVLMLRRPASVLIDGGIDQYFSRYGDLMAYIHAMLHEDRNFRAGRPNSEEARNKENLRKRLQPSEAYPPPSNLRESRINDIRRTIIRGLPYTIARHSFEDTYTDRRTGNQVQLSKRSLVYDHEYMKRKKNQDLDPNFPEYLVYRQMSYIGTRAIISDVLVVTEEALKDAIKDFKPDYRGPNAAGDWNWETRTESVQPGAQPAWFTSEWMPSI